MKRKKDKIHVQRCPQRTWFNTRSNYWALHVKCASARLCSLGLLSPTCQYSLWPWHSSHRNQGTKKEERKKCFSGFPSNNNNKKIGKRMRVMIPGCPGLMHPQKTCSWKDHCVLWVILSVQSWSPKATHYDIVLVWMGPMFYISCRRSLLR